MLVTAVRSRTVLVAVVATAFPIRPDHSRAQVLVLEDWTAFCLDCLGGDLPAIAAWYSLVVDAMKCDRAQPNR